MNGGYVILLIIGGIILLVGYLVYQAIGKASINIPSFSEVNQDLNDFFSGPTTVGQTDPITGAYAEPM
jgi:hypothetical protein